MNAEQLVKFAARRVEKIFRQRGEIIWMYHFIKDDGQHGVFVPPPFLDGKDAIVAATKALFEAEHVVAYVYLNEAWTLQEEAGASEVDALMAKYGSLEHVPGRREVVVILAEDANGVVGGYMEINRPAGRKPYLGKLEVERPDAIEGRMVGLLPRRGAMK